MTTPKFVSIKTEAIERILSSSPMTGEEVRIAIAYFIAAGNVSEISRLTEILDTIVLEKIEHLKHRGFF